MKFNSLNGYKATIYKNGVPMNSKKDFFPDEWNEEKVIDAIKEGYDNATQVSNSNKWIGTGKGISIKIHKNGNGVIGSAFPNY